MLKHFQYLNAKVPLIYCVKVVSLLCHYFLL
nr:MAG TPA: hypothetical protein [Caudoviricetes sp.]